MCNADLWWLEVAESHGPFGLVAAAEDVVSLIAVIGGGGDVDVRHVARTLTRPPAISTATGMTARLVGEDGAVLASAPLRRLGGLAGCGCGGGAGEGDAVAQALIPNVALGARIEIVAGEKVVWARAAPPRTPEIARFTCRVVKGAVRAGWRSPTATDCWLRWSRDGEDWRALATGLTGNRAEIAARHLPPGPVRIQLVAHDGFSSTHSAPVGLEIAARAPDVAIMHPRPGATHVDGQALRLFAAAVSASGEPISPESWRWQLDGADAGEGELPGSRLPRRGSTSCACASPPPTATGPTRCGSPPFPRTTSAATARPDKRRRTRVQGPGAGPARADFAPARARSLSTPPEPPMDCNVGGTDAISGGSREVSAGDP